jgi:hypothetical protein
MGGRAWPMSATSPPVPGRSAAAVSTSSTERFPCRSPSVPPVVSTTLVVSSPISHVAEVLAGFGGVADYPDLFVGDRHGDGLLLGDQEPPQPGPPGADIVGSAG